MSKLSKKKIIIIIVLLLLIIGTALYIFVIKPYLDSRITGQERFNYELVFMDQIEEVSEQMDTTIILYYQGSIDESAYLNQMNMIDNEMVLFYKQYNEFEENVNVIIGTHTVASKTGLDSAKNTYKLIDDLVDYSLMESNYKDKDKLMYLYLAQRDKIAYQLNIYNECLGAEFKNQMGEYWEELVKEAEMSSETDAEKGED